MKQLFLSITVCTVLAACGPTEHDQAVKYAEKAREALEKGDTATALCLADTIHANFPKETAVRRMADTLVWHIEYDRLTQSLPTLSRQIKSADSVFTAISPKFKFYKDVKYEDTGHFEHRLLVTEKGVNRCYLKPEVDERGTVSVASHYIGAHAEHTGFAVVVGDYAISTGEDLDISKFDDEETYHEIMTPSDEKSLDMMRFIAEHADERVRVILEGKPYTYYLNTSEKQAFRESFILHKALDNLYKLNDSELRTQQKIEILKRKLGTGQ